MNGYDDVEYLISMQKETKKFEQKRKDDYSQPASLQMKKQIAVLPGDGVGPEIIEQALVVLKKVAEKFGHDFVFTTGLIGAAAIDAAGDPFPKATQTLCEKSDAILFGAIGDPKYDNDPTAKVRPEQGLLAMRKALGLYANVRPILTFPDLVDHSPLKESLVSGVDFVVIRELIGGIYFGKRGRNKAGTAAFDTAEYTQKEIKRIATFAFELARSRHSGNPPDGTASRIDSGVVVSPPQNDKVTPKLTVVDKANVLETSRLWRETIQEMEKDYPEVVVEYLFVDNAAMQFIKNPKQFDVIVTENMFGDILTDEASVITGSLGMLPSASIGEKTSLYEPIHGSYPKATGLNTANPIGTILASAMMLEYSFGLKKERDAIFTAVEKVLAEGFGTKDLNPEKLLGTKELAEKISKAL